MKQSINIIPVCYFLLPIFLWTYHSDWLHRTQCSADHPYWQAESRHCASIARCGAMCVIVPIATRTHPRICERVVTTCVRMSVCARIVRFFHSTGLRVAGARGSACRWGCCSCGTSCGGLNYPYRGWKDSFWEGGFRGNGFVHSPLLAVSGYTYSHLLHVSDWFVTHFIIIAVLVVWLWLEHEVARRAIQI
jgi:hypothetical protein